MIVVPDGGRRLTTRELAERAGVSSYRIKQWVKKGLIRYYQLPGEHPFYDEAEAMGDIRRLLDSSQSAPADLPRGGDQ